MTIRFNILLISLFRYSIIIIYNPFTRLNCTFIFLFIRKIVIFFIILWLLLWHIGIMLLLSHSLLDIVLMVITL